MLQIPKINSFASAGFAIVSVTVIGSVQANQCAIVVDNSQRLACYDQQFRVVAKVDSELDNKVSNGQPGVVHPQLDSAPKAAYARSKMIDDWELSPDSGHKALEIRRYKPVYILLGTRTDNINEQPHSDNPANTASSPISGLSASEAQFQLSFKTKILNNIFGDNGSLWAGYTQSSRWQIYSGDISRPFRETNYEPEAMLMFRTPLALGNWNLRMSGIGVNHQSNGRANPLSRSWNRVIAHFGIENDDLSIQIRPWMRIKEDVVSDNNPRIENYIGRGELILAKRFGGHVVSLQGRHSLRFGDDSRGSLKFDWAIPLAGQLNAHLSLFSGYGESLIDYNNRQTLIGAGFSLVDW